jgi:hypothetical protein
MQIFTTNEFIKSCVNYKTYYKILISLKNFHKHLSLTRKSFYSKILIHYFCYKNKGT